MKAIMIVDLDDSFIPLDEDTITLEKGTITYRDLNRNPFKIIIEGLKLKPLPKEREAFGILNDYERGKILGFNSCLKIILGEENE